MTIKELLADVNTKWEYKGYFYCADTIRVRRYHNTYLRGIYKLEGKDGYTEDYYGEVWFRYDDKTEWEKYTDHSGFCDWIVNKPRTRLITANAYIDINKELDKINAKEVVTMTYDEGLEELSDKWKLYQEYADDTYEMVSMLNTVIPSLYKIELTTVAHMKTYPALWITSSEYLMYWNSPDTTYNAVKNISGSYRVMTKAKNVIKEWVAEQTPPPEITPGGGTLPPPEEEKPPGEEVPPSSIGDKINDIWKLITDLPGTIKDALGEALSAIMELLLTPINQIKDTFTDLYNTFQKWSGDFISTLQNTFANIEGFFEYVSDQITNFVGNVIEGLNDVVGKLTTWVKDIADNILSGLKTAWYWLTAGIKDIVGDVWSWIKGIGEVLKQVFLSVWDAIKGALNASWNWIKDKFNDVITAIGKVIDAVKQWIVNAVQSVVGTFTDLVGDIWQWILDTIDKLIKWFDKVFDTTPDKLALVFEDIMTAQQKAVEAVAKHFK